MLNSLLADVFVFTDHMSGGEAGASPGYGIMLVAETTSGRLMSAEWSASRETLVSEQRKASLHRSPASSTELLLVWRQLDSCSLLCGSPHGNIQ